MKVVPGRKNQKSVNTNSKNGGIMDFKKRLENFSDKDEILAFNLAMVSEGLEIVKDLSDKNIGWEEVEKRLGEYKSWDPDILKVDKDTEKHIQKTT